MREVDVERALIVMLLPILLAACTGSSAPNGGDDRCLYAVEGMDVGRIMRWGSCSNPPPYAISRISD
jgi:hypothetical protein